MTPQGLRLWTTEGAVHETTDLADWPRLPSSGVQIVQLVYAETYRSWQTRRNTDGRLHSRGAGTWVTEHYCQFLHQCDYYWQDADGLHGTNVPAELPPGLSEGAVKTGAWMPDQDFVDLYNRASAERGPVKGAQT